MKGERLAIRRYQRSAHFEVPQAVAQLARRRTEFLHAMAADTPIRDLVAWAWLQGCRDTTQAVDRYLPASWPAPDGPADWSATG